MHAQGRPSEPSKPAASMPATDDEIREKYLERAIRELNTLTRELQACERCPRGHLMPVLGSGHPQADVFLLKYAPTAPEIEEGVAFFGRSGTALMKAFKRLAIDPLAVYGTLCVKCPVPDTSLADPGCVGRVADELAIVQPKIVVVMGEDALEILNDLDLPLSDDRARLARRAPAPDTLDRGALRAEHRRGARRGERQARVLVGVPGARRVVRRPAAVLTPRRRPRGAIPAIAIPLAALAYFLAAPALPALAAGDATVLAAGSLGVLLVAGSALSLLALRDAPVALVLVALGSGLLVAALNAGDVGAAANVVEALLAATIGLLFARALSAPAIAVAVPVFVALVDVWSVATGPTAKLIANGTPTADPLSFDLPAWGSMGSAGHLGLSDAVFLAMFAAWALRHDCRRTATIVALTLSLVAAIAVSVAVGRAIPAIPFLAAAFLLPNADRLAALLRRT